MQRQHPLLLLTLIGFIAVLSGCFNSHKPPPDSITGSTGEARVLEAYPERWELLLKTHEGNRIAYWTEQTVFIKGKQAMADYNVPKGADIQYRGVENRNEIWLRQVWIIKE